MYLGAGVAVFGRMAALALQSAAVNITSLSDRKQAGFDTRLGKRDGGNVIAGVVWEGNYSLIGPGHHISGRR